MNEPAKQKRNRPRMIGVRFTDKELEKIQNITQLPLATWVRCVVLNALKFQPRQRIP